MKLFIFVIFAVVFYLAITALAAVIFAAALGVFAAKSGLPALTWWESFCALVCVAVLGSSFGYAGTLAKVNRS